MKFQLLNKIPDNVGLAFSGGSDSVAFFYFLKNYRKNVTLFFFDHANELAKEELEFVSKFATDNNVQLVIGTNSLDKPKGQSCEEFWRNQRYEFFKKQDIQIITGHHLDDAVETWLWGCFNGQPQLMPYEHANIIRPFLLTKKSQITEYLEYHNLEYFKDKSNKELKFARNRIRHNILPEVLKVNPGIHKVIKKKLMEKYK